jgi:hypothetical protein
VRTQTASIPTTPESYKANCAGVTKQKRSSGPIAGFKISILPHHDAASDANTSTRTTAATELACARVPRNEGTAEVKLLAFVGSSLQTASY